MLIPNHPIFRQNAVKHYMQSREKDTLPRFISLPIALFLWGLLGLLLVVGLLAWYEQIPTYATGQGAVLSPRYMSHYAQQGAVAAAFFAIDQAKYLHVGQRVAVSFTSSSDNSLKGTVLAVDAAVSPDSALSHYGLSSTSALSITQPSVVVIIKLDAVSPSLYAGSTLTANVQVGSRRIISLLPGIGSFWGEENT
ncbi:hypothetical protein KSF_028230 [Reticulibacter mediterranei]|uniref:HlyD family secretion protein n=1 Tax=Reticulibacter mediterranei TaxID=2778369 RepID=A0A8J3IL79_9CHLR|nr:hypothetical protein [Reticulibacter mediterranei]GHO92775.1 hypothetical protein KSF_028230 [Reticulibacter mediterranei]